MCGAASNCLDVWLNLLIIGLSNGAVIALNAIGVTLVYSVARTINFAHGDLYALTTVLVTTLITGLGIGADSPPVLRTIWLIFILILSIAFGVLLNITVERLAFRPFRGRSQLAPLIATLGLSFILYQVALIWRKLLPSWIPGEHRSYPGIPEFPRNSIPDLLPNIELTQALGLPFDITLRFKDLLIILLAIIAAVSVSWFLRRSRLGQALRAVALDPTLAELTGISLNRAYRQVFALGGGLAGAAAFGFVLYTTHPYSNHGAQSGLIAFTAAILGGIGSPVGALLSSLVLGIFSAISDYYFAAQWTPVLVQAIVVLLLLVRPTGLTAQESADDLSKVPVRDVLATLRPERPLWVMRVAGLGLLTVALIYPILDTTLGIFKQVIISNILVFVVLALGLNILLGFAGLLDLGYAASFGIGAYSAALLVNPWGQLAPFIPQPLDFTVVALASIALATLLGVFNGWLTLRLRADYLAIVTLAFGLMVKQAATNLVSWTGGVGGVSALPAPHILAFFLSTPAERYYLALFIVLLVAGISYRLRRSRQGRAWQAIGDDEVAAASCGVDVVRAKTLAFALGAGIAGLAGALYVGLFGYIAPDQIDFSVSAMLLAMVIIGGAGSIPGAMMGALVIASYDRLWLPWLGGYLAQFRAQQGGLYSLLDLRELNFLAFGLVLYLSVFIRARQR